MTLRITPKHRRALRAFARGLDRLAAWLRSASRSREIHIDLIPERTLRPAALPEEVR